MFEGQMWYLGLVCGVGRGRSGCQFLGLGLGFRRGLGGGGGLGGLLFQRHHGSRGLSVSRGLSLHTKMCPPPNQQGQWRLSAASFLPARDGGPKGGEQRAKRV